MQPAIWPREQLSSQGHCQDGTTLPCLVVCQILLLITENPGGEVQDAVVDSPLIGLLTEKDERREVFCPSTIIPTATRERIFRRNLGRSTHVLAERHSALRLGPIPAGRLRERSSSSPSSSTTSTINTNLSRGRWERRAGRAVVSGSYHCWHSIAFSIPWVMCDGLMANAVTS